MDIKLSERKIVDRCGTAASKRGEAYFKDNKVTIDKQGMDYCEATIAGVEDFYVVISKRQQHLHTSCTCPKLSSFTKDCQHIAAVFHALLHKQQATITKELIGLFNDGSAHSIASQQYFETRQELSLIFNCNIIQYNNENVIALKITMGNKKIASISAFLEAIQQGGKYLHTKAFIYDPAKHSFSKETDAVLQHLLGIAQDEQLLKSIKSKKHDNLIVIPPSKWEILFPLLKEENLATLTIQGKTFPQLCEENKVLPLKFTLKRIDDKATLQIVGMEQLMLLEAYQLAIYEGIFYQLSDEVTKRLVELQSLLQDYHSIPIQEDQLLFFSKSVVPKLKSFGEVHIEREMMRYFNYPPLKAKLFLDRVNNRLLAGLEFHYDYVIIQPLKDGGSESKSLTLRDIEKEDTILTFMDEARFLKTEGGYILHNEELEYHFLNNILPKLEEYVEVYATTAVRNRILPQPVKPKIKIKHQKDRMNWLDFTFEMEGFPEKEIKAILSRLQEKKKYYRLQSGALMSLETEEFAEIQKFLMQVPSQTDLNRSTFEIPLLKGLKLIDVFNLDDVLEMEASFREFLQEITQLNLESIQVPDNINATLRDYQKQGFHWLITLSHYGFSGVLADDMGLGKTLQSITYIASYLKEMRANDQQVLIICPSSVMYNWQNEIRHFAPEMKAAVVHGNIDKRKHLLSNARKLDILITSYSLLRSDINWYNKEKFHTIFFDEAQAFKNPTTQTAKAAKKLQSINKFALTGTPMENTTEELWSIFHVIFPELFGSIEEFKHLPKKKIARRIRPFMLRRMKKDVALELPEKIETKEIVELHSEQKKLYTAYLAKLRHETLKHLDDETIEKNRIKILAGLTRLRQICCHPELFIEGYKGTSAKFTRLMEIIEEAKNSNRSMLIFSQFTSMLGIIARHLAELGLSFFYLDGSTPPEERATLSTRFNKSERKIFLISLKAGGTGLNLTGADTVILYDLWWNPAIEEQAEDRAYRIGQENTVQVIKLLSKGTIEEKMYQLQERKRNLIEEIINPEATSPVLTVADMKELLN